MTARRLNVLYFVIVTVAIPVGMKVGAWWIVFAAGLAFGLILQRARGALVLGAIAGLAGWGGDLLVDQLLYGLQPTSTSLAAMLGLTGAALVPVALTVLVGLLLGLTGAWLGATIRDVALGCARSGALEELGDQRLEVKDPVLTQR